ncbi:cobalamin-dependent protein [bacterium]|nr:cobalamin-dependent protein [bacterium]
MKITLFEITCPDIRSFGIRCIGSYLRKHGFEVNLVFMPPGLEKIRPGIGEVHLFKEKILDELAELCSDSQLIGISFLTYYFDKASQLTRSFQEKLGIPVIWGGIHPTIKPEEGVDIAEYVCIGEGEEALLELCQKMDNNEDTSNVRNIWFKKDGEIVQNEIRPLVRNIDIIVDPDYEIEFHYFHDTKEGKIRKLDDALLKKIMSFGPLSVGQERYHYNTMMSRGCPYACAYCCNNYYRKMYGPENYLRWRSVNNFIGELENITIKFPFINAFNFFDDSFFSMPDKMMKEFCQIYKEKFNFPFTSQSTPHGAAIKKLDQLINAGLRRVEVGIQTGSERINKMYNRRFDSFEILEASRNINRFKKIILPPDYHLILDNPWETTEDILDTLNLVLKLPRPFFLKPSSLVLYPNTGIYHKAMNENMITKEITQIYRKAFGAHKPSYLNFLIILAGSGYFPRALIRILKNTFFIKIFQKESLSFLFVLFFKVHKILSIMFEKLILKPKYQSPEKNDLALS